MEINPLLVGAPLALSLLLDVGETNETIFNTLCQEVDRGGAEPQIEPVRANASRGWGWG